MTKTRVALITGAGSGIGRATALRMAADGLHVVLTGRSTESLAETAGGLAAAARVVACDVSVPADVQRLVGEVERAFGRLDIVVNCAAQSIPGTLEQVTPCSAERLWRVNVLGPTLVTQHCVPLLSTAAAERDAASPVVVNVTTSIGGRGWPGSGMYAATKAALDSLTRTWAVELAPAGIRVVGVAPGAVETAMAANGGADADGVARLRQWQREHTPQRRVAHPREVAEVIEFVASTRASFVTGTVVAVDGGAAVA